MHKDTCKNSLQLHMKRPWKRFPLSSLVGGAEMVQIGEENSI